MICSTISLIVVVCCVLLAAVACIGLGEGAYGLQVQNPFPSCHD